MYNLTFKIFMQTTLTIKTYQTFINNRLDVIYEACVEERIGNMLIGRIKTLIERSTKEEAPKMPKIY